MTHEKMSHPELRDSVPYSRKEARKAKVKWHTWVKWKERTHVYAPPIVADIGDLMFSIRWIQVPIYLALFLCMAGFCLHLLYETCVFMFTFKHGMPGFLWHDEDDWTMFPMSLVDASMVANLVVMVVQGGYVMFIKDFGGLARDQKLGWMHHLNSNSLKIKLSIGLVSISGVKLLGTFMHIGISGLPDGQVNAVKFAIIIHLVFLATALAITWIDRIMHPPVAGHGHDEHHESSEPAAHAHTGDDTHGATDIHEDNHETTAHGDHGTEASLIHTAHAH